MPWRVVSELKNGTLFAISAAVGGLLGKIIYNKVAALFSDPNTAGGVQALLLFLATFATLIYTIKKDKIKPKQINNLAIVIVLGFSLGIFGSFLGIGGGPFNVAVLCYFFSMPTKTATQNSLYIILFSQAASTLKASGNGIPASLSLELLAGMIIIGIIGSEIGRQINKKLSEKQADCLLNAAMVLIMLINVYNIYQYLL